MKNNDWLRLPALLPALLVALLLLAAPLSLRAQTTGQTPGGALLRYVPPDHNAVVFLKPTAVLGSPLYAALKSDPAFRPVTRQVAALETATGLNARRDLTEVLWSGLMTEPERRGVLLARGNLNRPALERRMKASPQYRTAAYKGRACHSWFDAQGKRLMNGAFLADDLILLSDSPTTLRHALDAGAGGDALVQKFAMTRTLAQRVAPGSAAWGLALRSGVMPAEVYENPLLNNLRGAIWAARLGERVDMTLHGELPDAQTAQQYRVMLDGMLTMTRLMGDEPELQALAQRATVSQAGTGVSAQLAASNAEAVALIRQAMSR